MTRLLRQLCADYLAYRAWDRGNQGGRWPQVLQGAARDLLELSRQEPSGKDRDLSGKVASVLHVMLREAYPLVQAARKAFMEAEGKTLEEVLARLQQMGPGPFTGIVEQASFAVREMDALDHQGTLEFLRQRRKQAEGGTLRKD